MSKKIVLIGMNNKKAETKKEETKAKKPAPKQEDEGTLPPDKYTELLKPQELEISETSKLVISVARGGEDGLPCVDIRTFVNTPKYCGPTKKGVNIEAVLLEDLIDMLQDIKKQCEKKHLLD